MSNRPNPCLHPQNKEMLKALGLDAPMFEPKEKPRKKAATLSKKRKSEAAPHADSENTEDTTSASPKPPTKAAKVDASEGSVRRSSRNAGKTVDYKAETRLEVRSLTHKMKDGTTNRGPLGSENGAKRKHDPFVESPHISCIFHVFSCPVL